MSHHASLAPTPVPHGRATALELSELATTVIETAQGAIDELAQTEPAGLPVADAHTRLVIARSEAGLAASRLLLRSATDALEAAGGPVEPPSHEQRIDLRAAMGFAARTSREVLMEAHEVGSSSARYDGSRLESSFRDGMVALQQVNRATESLQ